MPIYQWFVEHISAPLIARKNNIPDMFRHLRSLEESQHWPRQRLIDLQTNKVRSLLTHAYKNTAYYNQLFDTVGLNPNTFKDLRELEKLPFLSKDIIRDNQQALIAKNFKSSELHFSETGGTTGVKMKFYRDNACLSQKEAALYRYERWTGWRFGERMGLVWPAQQDYVGHWTLKAKIKNEFFARQVVLPAAILDDERIENYVQLLLKKKPVLIRAFTSPVCEIAKYLLAKNITVPLKGVITTGEPLFGHQRELISQAFQCEVFDSYRTREAGPLAQECEVHDGLHINAESLYVESVPPESPELFEAGLGEIVVTDLLNYGMPLIRYKMGDMGILSHEPCRCGRGLPMLKKLAGRTPDMFFTPTGKRIAAGSLVLYVVDEAPGMLGQIQIIQDRLDHLIIRFTPNPPLTNEVKEYQVRTVKQLFGETMDVSFEEVAEIPKEKSGKYRFTKCLLS